VVWRRPEGGRHHATGEFRTLRGRPLPRQRATFSLKAMKCLKDAWARS
jgi:hypothetical protein